MWCTETPYLCDDLLQWATSNMFLMLFFFFLSSDDPQMKIYFWNTTSTSKKFINLNLLNFMSFYMDTPGGCGFESHHGHCFVWLNRIEHWAHIICMYPWRNPPDSVSFFLLIIQMFIDVVYMKPHTCVMIFCNEQRLTCF